MAYEKIEIPSDGEKIAVGQDYSLRVPDKPIIPYIEGDGIGIDITPVMKRVVEAAGLKAYGGSKQIQCLTWATHPDFFTCIVYKGHPGARSAMYQWSTGKWYIILDNKQGGYRAGQLWVDPKGKPKYPAPTTNVPGKVPSARA